MGVYTGIMKEKNIILHKIGIFFLILVAVTSLIINLLQVKQRTDNNQVIRVVDGDSFDLKDGRRIRLLSIDAPERDRCLYSEAGEKLRSLILNKKVKLKNIVTDDYGRILADVFVNDIHINKIMLLEGLTRFTYTGQEYTNLKAINLNAKKLKIGIYSPLCRTTSIDENCKIKANNNHGKKFYFTPQCRNYEQVIVDESFGDRWFCTEEKAIDAGFTKAKNC